MNQTKQENNNSGGFLAAIADSFDRNIASLESQVRNIIKPMANKPYRYSEDGPYVVVTTGSIQKEQIQRMEMMGYDLSMVMPCLVLTKKGEPDIAAITYYFERRF